MNRASAYVIGGCAYRMQIDARLAASIAGTAIITTLMSQMEDDPRAPSLILRAVDFTHTSNLPQGRCLWIRSILEMTDVEYAISVDSDCWYDADKFSRALLAIDAANRAGDVDDVGMWTAPVAQANGEINWRVKTSGGRIAVPSRDELALVMDGRLPIERSGWGLVVLNLSWWREFWAKPEPFINSILTGEDMELTRGVRDRDGRVAPLNVNVGHAAFAL